MHNPLVVQTVGLENMPQKPIFTRLGLRMRSDIPLIMSQYQNLIDQLVRETRVRMFYRFKSIRVQGNEVDLDGYRFASTLVAQRFSRAAAAALMAASALPEDMSRLQTLHADGNLQHAVILDAVLSEKVDWALDFLQKNLAPELRRSGRMMGGRISCGYGDFHLEHQQYFYRELDLGQYGIHISERHILQPEKTVTALAPIHEWVREDEPTVAGADSK